MRFLLWISLFGMFACSGEKAVTKSEPSHDRLIFTYEKTACFGKCPEFKLSVYQSGKAILNGKKNFDYIGEHICADCDEQMMAKVVEECERADFWKMNDRYDPGVTDLPSTILVLYAHSEPKEVVAVMDEPEGLKKIHQAIEDLYFQRIWKKTE